MFRNGAAFLAAAILASGTTPILPAAPAAAVTKWEIGLCRDVLLPQRPNSNLGECLSYINVAQNGSDGEVSHFCDYLIDNDPFTFELLFSSRWECLHLYGGRGPFH
jgi:hypothetical protein